MITTDANSLRDKLIAAGVRAVTDPARVAPPCVFVTPVSAEFDTNCLGEGTTEWQLWCIGPGNGTKNSFDACAQLTAATLRAIPGVQNLRSDNLRSGEVEYPAFVLTLRTVSAWV